MKIVATGSNAFYFDEKFRDFLAGRKRNATIYIDLPAGDPEFALNPEVADYTEIAFILHLDRIAKAIVFRSSDTERLRVLLFANSNSRSIVEVV